MPNKQPIGIVTDEACDLPREMVEKYNIGIVPLNVSWPEIENIPGENVFQKIRELEKKGDKSFAKTSQPSPKAFIDVFESQLDKFEKIICLTITSKHSGTYNSACQAKRFMGEAGKNVYVIDSLNASAGLGLIILKTIALIEKGLVAEEIMEKIKTILSDVKVYIMLEGPKRLEASGRLSPTMAGWLVKMQNIGIRPVIGLKDGKLSPIGITTGAKDVVVALFKQFESKTKSLREKGVGIEVAITHCDNKERADRFRGLVENSSGNVKIVFVNITDNVLGSILGPDSLILGWSIAE